jgi:cytochrome b6-f complex iron-sulfur subunit
MMNRREFLGWVGVGGVASYLPIALVACTKTINRSEVAQTPAHSDSFTKIGTLTELKQKGQLSQGQVLVISPSSDSKDMIAVNPTCTHAGCTVTWEKDQKVFVCPCHSTQYDKDGKVLHGPAKEALATYLPD